MLLSSKGELGFLHKNLLRIFNAYSNIDYLHKRFISLNSSCCTIFSKNKKTWRKKSDSHSVHSILSKSCIFFCKNSIFDTSQFGAFKSGFRTMNHMKNASFSWILSTVLSKYIEEIATDQLNIAIFSGETSLDNLTLRSDALTSMNLPFTIIRGTVGSIKISRSLCSMLVSPFTLEISDVYILATVNASVMYTENESCIPKMIVTQKPSAFSSTISSTISTKVYNILANIKYIFKNIHIRIDHTFNEGFVSGGLFIPSIELFSIDNNNQQIDFKQNLEHVQKKFIIHNLSFYIDTEYDETHKINLENFQSEMQNLISDEGHSFIFQNKSIEGHCMSNIRTLELSQFDINLDDIILNLSQSQYRSILLFSREFHKFNIRKYFSSLGRPSHFPRSQRSSTSWWQYATHSAIRINYDDNFNPSFALNFLNKRQQCLQTLVKSKFSKQSINEQVEKNGQKFMRSLYKYAKYFKQLPSLFPVHTEHVQNGEAVKVTASLKINKLEARLYNKYMESTLSLLDNSFDFSFIQFGSTKLKCDIKSVDLTTNKEQYLKIGTTEKPAISAFVNSELRDIHAQLTVNDPTIIFERRLAVYIKHFFNVRIETVANLFQIKNKKKSKKSTDVGRPLNASAEIINLLIKSQSRRNVISFLTDVIHMNIIEGHITGDLNGVNLKSNESDILKKSNYQIDYNNNHLIFNTDNIPLAIDYEEIEGIKKNIMEAKESILGSGRKRVPKGHSKINNQTPIAVNEQSPNTTNVISPAETQASENNDDALPFTLDVDIPIVTFNMYHAKEETLALSIEKISVSRGNDLAFNVKSGDITIDQMIVGNRDFVRSTGFSVHFAENLDVDLNGLFLKLRAPTINYLLTILGMFDAELKRIEEYIAAAVKASSDSSKVSFSSSQQLSRAESAKMLTSSSSERSINLDNDEEEDIDEEKRLMKMIEHDRKQRMKKTRIEDDHLHHQFLFSQTAPTAQTQQRNIQLEDNGSNEQQDTQEEKDNPQLGLEDYIEQEMEYEYEDEEETPKKDSKPFSVNVNLKNSEIHFLDPYMNFGVCKIELINVPITMGDAMKLNCYLTNMDFKGSETLLTYNNFMTIPKFHFGFYDQTIFVETPELGMDFQYDYLMEFINYASGLYRPYLDPDLPKVPPPPSTGLHLPDLKYKINFNLIKIRAVTRYINDPNHFMNLALESLILDSDDKSLINFKISAIKIDTFDDHSMIRIKKMKIPIKFGYDDSGMVNNIDVTPSFRSIKYEHDLAEELVLCDFFASLIPRKVVETKKEKKGLRRPKSFRFTSTNHIELPPPGTLDLSASSSESLPTKDTSFKLGINVTIKLIEVITRSYKETRIFLEGVHYVQGDVNKDVSIHRLYIQIFRHKKNPEEVASKGKQHARMVSRIQPAIKQKDQEKKKKSSSSSKVAYDVLVLYNNDDVDDLSLSMSPDGMDMKLLNIKLIYEYKIIVQLLELYQRTRFLRYQFSEPDPETEKKAEEEKKNSKSVTNINVSNISIVFPVTPKLLSLNISQVSFFSTNGKMTVGVDNFISYIDSDINKILSLDKITYGSTTNENENILEVYTSHLLISVGPMAIVSAIIIANSISDSFKALVVSNDNYVPEEQQVEKGTKTIYNIDLGEIEVQLNRADTLDESFHKLLVFMVLKCPRNKFSFCFEDKNIEINFDFASLEYINPQTSLSDLLIEPFRANVLYDESQGAQYCKLEFTKIATNISFASIQKMMELLMEIKTQLSSQIVGEIVTPKLTIINTTAEPLKLSVRELSNTINPIPVNGSYVMSADNVNDDFTLYYSPPGSKAPIDVQISQLFYPFFITKNICISMKRTRKGPKIRFSSVTTIINKTEFNLSVRERLAHKNYTEVKKVAPNSISWFKPVHDGNLALGVAIEGCQKSKGSFKIKDIKKEPHLLPCKYDDQHFVDLIAYAETNPSTFVLNIIIDYAVSITNKMPYPITFYANGSEIALKTMEEAFCKSISVKNETFQCGVAFNSNPCHSQNNQVSLADNASTAIPVKADSSGAVEKIVVSVDRNLDRRPLRIVVYAPIVFFNQTGLHISLISPQQSIQRSFVDKMLIAGNDYYLLDDKDKSGDKNKSRYTFKVAYQTDKIIQLPVNPNAVNIDKPLLIPYDKNANIEANPYDDSSNNFSSGNMFEVGFSADKDLYLPLHYNIRSAQPDSLSLIVSIFTQLIVRNNLQFAIYIQPVGVDKELISEKVKIDPNQSVHISVATYEFRFAVSTDNPKQKPAFIKLGEPCHTTLFFRTPEKQNIAVNLETTVDKTDFVATFSAAEFSDSPYLIVNMLKRSVTYSQENVEKAKSIKIDGRTSAILGYWQPFEAVWNNEAGKGIVSSNPLRLKVKNTTFRANFDECGTYTATDVDDNTKEYYYIISKFGQKTVIAIRSKEAEPKPIKQYQYIIFLKAFRLSLIDSAYEEIMLVNFNNIEMKSETIQKDKEAHYKLGIESFRIDNLNERAIWPVMLFSGKIDDLPGRDPFLSISVVQSLENTLTTEVKAIDIDINPVFVAVDACVFEDLLEFQKLSSIFSNDGEIISPYKESEVRKLTSENQTIIKDFKISDVRVFINYARNPQSKKNSFFLNLIPNIKDFEIKLKHRQYVNMDCTISKVIDHYSNEITSEFLTLRKMLGAVSTIAATQKMPTEDKLKFVTGLTIPSTRISEARAMPMKQISKYDPGTSMMQSLLRKKQKGNEVVELIFNEVRNNFTICLTRSYVALFKVFNQKEVVLDTVYPINGINTIDCYENMFRFVVASDGSLISFYVPTEKEAAMAKMYLCSIQNALSLAA